MAWNTTLRSINRGDSNPQAISVEVEFVEEGSARTYRKTYDVPIIAEKPFDEVKNQLRAEVELLQKRDIIEGQLQAQIGKVINL